MPTLSQTNWSIINTVVEGPDGAPLYTVVTPFKLGTRITTISRSGRVIATITWNVMDKDRLSFEGRDEEMKVIFPKPRAVSTSRVYTTASGRSFKWKNDRRLYCVDTETEMNLATYYRVWFQGIRGKKSTLDINDSSEELMDALVVTWIIMEKYAEDD
ncbi:hypothetical protein BDV93DRAFT_526180 [Ceratobasidium sp. AG-I]|nr:hypothetical protein BDV93DRAFT_526180 [Ceratobasidium sp. AG-I]